MAAVKEPKQKEVNEKEAQNTTTQDEPAKLTSKEKKELKKQEKLRKKEEKQKNKKKKGVLSKIIPIFLFLAVISGAVAVLWFDVFSIRSKYLDTTLTKVPIVKDVLPISKEKTPQVTNEQLTAQINELQAKLDRSEADLKAAQSRNNEYIAEIDRLKVFSDQQLEFKKEKEEFERLVALKDPTAYSKFYETIYPENAQELYKEAVSTAARTKEFKDYIATYQAMDEAPAAKLLEQLILEDSNLVVLILKNIDKKKTAAILSEMTPENAATLTKALYPQTANQTP